MGARTAEGRIADDTGTPDAALRDPGLEAARRSRGGEGPGWSVPDVRVGHAHIVDLVVVLVDDLGHGG